MKIYIFTITGYLPEDITISQVYSKDFFIAWNTVIELTGANDKDIDFIGYEDTTRPINWNELDTNILLNN